jgi:hypothetical protein
MSEVLSAATLEPKQHLLLTNADITFTDDFVRMLPALDPVAVYYGHRLDIELDAANPKSFTARGFYTWGFDFFLLPRDFLDALKAEQLMPNEFRIGEPWWDYALPILALAMGFPLKRLVAGGALAVHYFHPARYSPETWLANGGRFMDLVQQLLARTPNTATGFLTDLLGIQGEPRARLDGVSQLIAQLLP